MKTLLQKRSGLSIQIVYDMNVDQATSKLLLMQFNMIEDKAFICIHE